VAALTGDMDIMSINVNRNRMEESKVSKQLATETICPFPVRHPSVLPRQNSVFPHLPVRWMRPSTSKTTHDLEGFNGLGNIRYDVVL
jgi:hypothetical protein